MQKLMEGKLGEHNIIDVVIHSGSLLRTSFQSKFSQIYEEQKTMLLNDLNDGESKLIIFQYLQRQPVQAQFLKKLEEDKTLIQYQKCLQKPRTKTDINFKGKFYEYIKVADKKCRNQSESMTLKTDYEVILEEASKCFKLKASDTRLESMSDEREGPSGNVHDWKIKIPRIKISTNFICRNCQTNFRKKAGLSMHEKKCKQRRSYDITHR